MIQEFLKDKKKIGIFAILGIMIVLAGIIYFKSGFKELKKNNQESIFVGDAENADKLTSVDSTNENSKEVNIPLKDKNIVVEIKGEVKKPDVYVLNENSIIKDLIEIAGGLTENADVSNINRAKKLQNHELIYIANKNEKTAEPQNIKIGTNQQASIDKKVNINSATIEELKTLDGIGDSKAKSIIEYREKNGNFNSIEGIKNVTGIGEKMFEKIKDQIEI